MKIRSLCVMKDEGDIIEQCLTAALEWSDEIAVLDNGSTDGGWEQVQRMASVDPRIIAVGQHLGPFHEGLRVRCFRALVKNAEIGDWWARLDADEFYASDPRTFLSTVPKKAFSVWGTMLTYYFTDLDLERLKADPSSFASSIPINLRSRYYLNDMSEPRIFRHARIMAWEESDEGFPPVMFREPVANERIIVRHYRYRTPEQIQRRLDARRTATYFFSHERVADWADAITDFRKTGTNVSNTASSVASTWRERIVPADSLSYDAGDGDFQLLPQFWPALPAARRTRALSRALDLLPARMRTRLVSTVRDMKRRLTEVAKVARRS